MGSPNENEDTPASSLSCCKIQLRSLCGHDHLPRSHYNNFKENKLNGSKNSEENEIKD